MKLGKTLIELATEVQRQQETRKDYLAASRAIHMAEVNGAAVINIPKQGTFGINNLAHGQIAQKVGIPKAYYDRMLASKPDLLASHVNHWLSVDDTRNMVRTLDQRVRALLSDRYRTLDNFELLNALVPMLQDRTVGFEVESSDVTETRFYLKLSVPSLVREVKVGDEVAAGVVIENSEVGMGRLSAAAFVKRLVCLNGMKLDKFSKKKNHIGRTLGDGTDGEEFYQDDTRKANDAAFFLQLRDTVKALLEPAGFDKVVADLRQATENKIEAKPEDVVEVVANKYAFNEGQKDSILRQLIDGGLGMNQYSLIQAVTRVAEDQADYDTASAMEAAGGDILTLSPADWKVLSTAQEAVPVRRRARVAA